MENCKFKLNDMNIDLGVHIKNERNKRKGKNFK